MIVYREVRVFVHNRHQLRRTLYRMTKTEIRRRHKLEVLLCFKISKLKRVSCKQRSAAKKRVHFKCPLLCYSRLSAAKEHDPL